MSIFDLVIRLIEYTTFPDIFPSEKKYEVVENILRIQRGYKGSMNPSSQFSFGILILVT